MKKTKIIAFILPNFGRNYDYRCWLVLRSQLVSYQNTYIFNRKRDWEKVLKIRKTLKSFGALSFSNDRQVKKLSEKFPGSSSQHQKYVKLA